MIHGETTLAMVVTVGKEMIEDVRMTVIVRVLLQKDTDGGRLRDLIFLYSLTDMLLTQASLTWCLLNTPCSYSSLL